MEVGHADASRSSRRSVATSSHSSAENNWAHRTSYPQGEEVQSASIRTTVGAVRFRVVCEPPAVGAARPLSHHSVHSPSAISCCSSADPNNPVLVLQQAVPRGDSRNRLSVLLAFISGSTTRTSSTCTVGSARCIEWVKTQRRRRTAIRTQKRRTRPVLFSAAIARRYWKIRIFAWWAHKDSNLGPAD